MNIEKDGWSENAQTEKKKNPPTQSEKEETQQQLTTLIKLNKTKSEMVHHATCESISN